MSNFLKSLVHILFGNIALSAVILSCKPTADPQVLLGTGSTGAIIQNHCNIIIPYYVGPASESLGLNEAADSAFSIWTKGFPGLVFQRVDNYSKAFIRIETREIADTDTLSSPSNPFMFKNITLKTRSKLIPHLQNTYSLLIDEDYPWEKRLLIKTLAYQIGKFLGIGEDGVEGDVMYAYGYADSIKDSHLKLSENDLKKVRALYSNCSQKRWTIRKSNLKPFIDPENKYIFPVTFSFPDNDTLYLLYPRKNEEYKLERIVFNNENPQLDYWVSEPAPLPSPSTSSNGNIPPGVISPVLSFSKSSLYSFSVDKRAFIGTAQWLSNPKFFKEYDVKKGDFKNHSIPISITKEIYSVALGGPNNKGYILRIHQDDANLSDLVIFDPNRNEWNIVKVPEPIYTATTIFATQDNRVCLYNGYAAYLLNTSHQWSVVRLTNLSQFIEPRKLSEAGNEVSLKGLNVGNRMFLIRDNYGYQRNVLGGGVNSELFSEEMWEITPDWEFIPYPSLDAQGIVLAVFGHKGAIIVITSEGRIYRYAL